MRVVCTKGLGLDCGLGDVKFELSYCIPVLLRQADELNPYLTGLRREDEASHVTFTRFRRNQGSCERFPIRNMLYDIVMGLVTTTLPLKMPSYRDEIEPTSAIHGCHVNIVATDVE